MYSSSSSSNTSIDVEIDYGDQMKIENLDNLFATINDER